MVYGQFAHKLDPAAYKDLSRLNQVDRCVVIQRIFPRSLPGRVAGAWLGMITPRECWPNGLWELKSFGINRNTTRRAIQDVPEGVRYHAMLPNDLHVVRL